jgi:hypothetical protein
MLPVEPPTDTLIATPSPVNRRPGASPLWAVFAFTFANSLGSGVVTNGIVFMSKHGYGFSDRDNYWLMVLLGMTYIVGALGAQPLIRALRRRAPGLSTRALLGGLMTTAGVLCAVPQIALWAGAGKSVWPIWLVVAIYSPLTGVLWPLVESYVSGGRSGHDLRSVISRWNVVWSSAVVVAYFGISPFVESAPALTIMILGLGHLACLLPLAYLGANPAPHDPEEHEPHPPVYAKLLVTFRMLLPMSYVVASALGPYLPGAMDKLQIPTQVQAMVASAWLIARVVLFAILNRWHGWHGRWYPAVVAGLLLITGFGAAVLSRPVGSAALLVTGLFMFGIGMAVVYSGAIYYAMEVGQSEVEAGGKHEALIGTGYTIGPGVLLIASYGVSYGILPESRFEPIVLGAVGLIGVLTALLVVHRVVVHVKAPSGQSH